MNKKIFFSTIFLTISQIIFAQATCNSAQTITAGSYLISSVDGSEVPTPVCASGGTGATAGKWFKYIAPADYTVIVTTDLSVNAAIDNRVNIYLGDCGSLTCIAGDDDSGTGYLCVVSFQVVEGNEYTIAFDNKWSSSGFTFELQETPPIVVNPNEISFTPQNISTITGDYKIAIADMNGDILDDIVSVSSTNVQIHYQQSGGGFNQVNIPTTTATYMPSWSMSIADYNKDGYGDLLYGGGNGVTFMRSNSDGTQFTQVSTSQYVFSQRSNFIDINNDGSLDAFVCHDVAPNVRYVNDGEGNLSFSQGGMGDHPNGGNYGSIWVDYNNDGLPDLFIAKCRGGQNTAKINELHRNNGNGTFTNVSVASNMADSVQTWSSAWNDFDNDGFLDALIGASSFSDGSHKLMHNNGDGTFSDITAGSGWDTFPFLSIEYVSYDFNNDGWADVFTNGQIMFNNGNNTFTPMAFSMNVGAIGDLNNDGFLDVQNGNIIYYSNPNSNNWTKIQLKGIESNSNGIGARVELYGSWGKQIRDVQSGIGFRHMGTMNVHFGIGAATSIDSIVVKWPSGKRDVFCNPAINTPLLLEEGSGPLPVAQFSADQNNVPEGTTVALTDASTECPIEWTWSVDPINGWNFVNGTSANSQDPEINFTTAGTYIVNLVTENSNGFSANSSTETIVVYSTAGIEEADLLGLKLFPNPVGNILNVEFDTNVEIIETQVYSLLGSVVKDFKGQTKDLNVSDLQNGAYLLKISTKNYGNYTIRFVKQ